MESKSNTKNVTIASFNSILWAGGGNVCWQCFGQNLLSIENSIVRIINNGGGIKIKRQHSRCCLPYETHEKGMEVAVTCPLCELYEGWQCHYQAICKRHHENNSTCGGQCKKIPLTVAASPKKFMSGGWWWWALFPGLHEGWQCSNQNCNVEKGINRIIRHTGEIKPKEWWVKKTREKFTPLPFP